MSAKTAEGRLFERISKHGSDGRFLLNHVEGVLWATNSYWAIAMPDGAHPLAKILRLFNLPLKPAALEVGDTIHPGSLYKVPDIARLVLAQPNDLEAIHPHTAHGEPLYCFDGYKALALYVVPGGRLAALNDEYRLFVEEMAPGDWYAGPDPLKPIFRLHDGKPTALIMGVRCRATEAVRDAAISVATGA